MTGEVECFCKAFVFIQVASQKRGCELYKLLVACCKWQKKGWNGAIVLLVHSDGLKSC